MLSGVSWWERDFIEKNTLVPMSGMFNKSEWWYGGRITQAGLYGHDRAPVDTLYDVLHLVKWCLFGVVAEEKDVCKKFVLFWFSLWMS